MLTRDQILAPRKVLIEPVTADELGEGATLNVRRLTAAEFMALTAKSKAEPDLTYAHWIAATVADEHGQSMFNADDAAAIAELPITLIERLVDAAQRLNIAKKAPGPNPAPRSDASPSPSR